MSLLVKICGLGNADDVEAAVSAGADAIGFVFADSPRKISPEAARDATRWVRSGSDQGQNRVRSGSDEGQMRVGSEVKCVAVMRHPTNEEWRQVLEVLQPDVLQTDIDDYEELDVPADVERWPVIREGHAALDNDLPATFLYEGADSGSGETVDWARAAAVATRGQMILAGGLAATNLHEAITTVRPFGVDVSSAVESERGVKDHALIKGFVAAARAAESAL